MNEAISSIVLAGGGTAGHVNPLLSVADEVRRRNPEAKVLVLGTAEGLEAQLVPARGYELWPIPKVPLPRRPSLDLFRLPGRLLAAIRSARQAIEKVNAQVVVGFGGYVSTPAYLAARRSPRVPVVVHEGNARAGLANRIGARWAKAVAVTFPTTKLRTRAKLPVEVVGLPMRPEITKLAELRDHDAVAARGAAAPRLGLDPALPTLLVSGGSTGAVSVNAAVAQAGRELLDSGIQVLHLTGKGKKAAVEAALQAAGLVVIEQRDGGDTVYGLASDGPGFYHVREYLTEMDLALASADLVVARAGAGMVCELAALGLPAIYVPLPIGNGEQRLNAAPLVAAGGGVLVHDNEFKADWVRSQIPDLINDPQRLARMAEAAREFGRPDAAARLVDLIEQVIGAQAETRIGEAE